MPLSLSGLEDISLNIFIMNVGGIILKINGIWMVIFVFLIQSSGEFLDILVSDLQILSFLLYTK